MFLSNLLNTLGPGLKAFFTRKLKHVTVEEWAALNSKLATMENLVVAFDRNMQMDDVFFTAEEVKALKRIAARFGGEVTSGFYHRGAIDLHKGVEIVVQPIQTTRFPQNNLKNRDGVVCLHAPWPPMIVTHAGSDLRIDVPSDATILFHDSGQTMKLADGQEIPVDVTTTTITTK